MSPDRFITSCSSWSDFWNRARALSSELEKGRAFERLTQLYLQTAPEYRTKLQHVLLLREVPPDIRERLNLPGPRDEGIDLIARTCQSQDQTSAAVVHASLFNSMLLPPELQPTDVMQVTLPRGTVAQLPLYRPVFSPWTGTPLDFSFGGKPALNYDQEVCALPS
jgi:hypothetical protein